MILLKSNNSSGTISERSTLSDDLYIIHTFLILLVGVEHVNKSALEGCVQLLITSWKIIHLKNS